MQYQDKLKRTQIIYVQEIEKVKQSAGMWQDFLDFAAKTIVSKNQNDYEFATKLSIHAINPNAKDCRTFGEWLGDNDGNHVSRGEKGIPVLTRSANGKTEMTYLFDSSQTALNKEPERMVIPPEKAYAAIQVLHRMIERSPYRGEMQRLFAETAEYKLCKQYGIDVPENPDRFNGIEKISAIDIAKMGIELNKLSIAFSNYAERNTVIERSLLHESRRNSDEISGRSENIQSRNERTGLHGQRIDRVDMVRGGGSPLQEVHMGRDTGVVRTESEELDIRTNTDGQAESNGKHGQIRGNEIEIPVADTVPDGHNGVERGEDTETLRNDEHGSAGTDREDNRDEVTVSGNESSTREISGEIESPRTIPERSGGTDTSGNGLRSMNSETAEPERASAVSDFMEKLKESTLSDSRIKDGTNIETDEILHEYAVKILLSDVLKYANDYNNFDKNIGGIRDDFVAEINKSISELKAEQPEITPTDFLDRIKELALNDDLIRNAALNSDDDSLRLEIKTRLQNYSVQTLTENTGIYANDYNNFNGNVDGIADKTAEEIFQAAIKFREEEQEKTIPENAQTETTEDMPTASSDSEPVKDNPEKPHNDIMDRAKTSKNGDLIVGNTTFRYIPDKSYAKVDRAIAEKLAQRLDDEGMKFSSVFKEASNTVTFTVSRPDREQLDNILDSLTAVTEPEQSVEPAKKPEITEERKKPANTLEHRIFANLEKMFPEIMSKDHNFEHYENPESSAVEPLSLEWLGGNKLSVMQTYVQYGDLMRDPDIVLDIDFVNQTAKPVSYENSGLGMYQEYEDGSKGQRDLTRFMNDWLRNLNDYDLTITRAIAYYELGDETHDIYVDYTDGEVSAVTGNSGAVEDYKQKHGIDLTYSDVPDEEIINGIVDSVMEKIMINDSLKSAAENNNIEDFEFAYNEKIDDILIDMLNDSNGKKADIISSMLNNDSGIKDRSFDEYIEYVYSSLRSDEPSVDFDEQLSFDVADENIIEPVTAEEKEKTSETVPENDSYLIQLFKDDDTMFYYMDGESSKLTHDTLSQIKENADNYVIAAGACLLSQDFMDDNNISFVKYGRDIDYNMFENPDETTIQTMREIADKQQNMIEVDGKIAGMIESYFDDDYSVREKVVPVPDDPEERVQTKYYISEYELESISDRLKSELENDPKPEFPEIKNLSQLKKNLQEGMEFEIVDHVRKECIGQHRRINGKNTVDITSEILDETGKGNGLKSHLDFGKSGSWHFNNGLITKTNGLNNANKNEDEVVISFRLIDDKYERTKALSEEVDKILHGIAPEIENTQPEQAENDKQILQSETDKSATLDLEVGDVIRYENKRYEIERVSKEEIALKDLDSPDYGGVLLSSVTVIGKPYDDWHKVLENSGYEILSKADKKEQRIDLMSDSSDMKDIPAYDDVSEVTLEYKGNIGSIEIIADRAFSLGSSCNISEDKTSIAIYTYENHKNELDEIADMLGLTKIEDEQKAPSKTVDTLVVGDIISYGDIKGTITKADDVMLTVKTAADPILGETIRGIINWKDKFEKNGFEYHGHEESEHIENVSGKKAKSISEPDKGQLNLFESSEPTAAKTADFKARTNEMFNNINGYSPEDIEIMVKEHISNIFSENEVSAEIKDLAVYGSRSRGLETDNSDIDVVVEIVNSDLKEDSLFNLLNEDGFEIDGIKIDINPIRPEETGTLEMYLENAEKYLSEKKEMQDHSKTREVTDSSNAEKVPENTSLTSDGNSKSKSIAELSPHEILSRDKFKVDKMEFSLSMGDNKIHASIPVETNSMLADRLSENVYLYYAKYNYDIFLNTDGTPDGTELRFYFQHGEFTPANTSVLSAEEQEVIDVVTSQAAQRIAEYAAEIGITDRIANDFSKADIQVSQTITEPSANSDNPDKIHEAFESVKKEYPDLSERAGAFLDRIEKMMKSDNSNTITPKILQSPAVKASYGGYIQMDKMFNGNLGEVIKKINSRLSGTEVSAEQPESVHNIPKISDIEQPVANDLLNALHKNFEDIPIDKTLDFFGNGNQISYQIRADILIREIQNSQISVPEAINVMQTIGFSFDNGISYNRSDISSEIQTNDMDKSTDRITETKQQPEFSENPDMTEETKPYKFSISDDNLGNGGKKERFLNNIEAIKTLKKIEEEERHATPEEQEKLSKYVGWGGIQEAFDSRIPEWNREYYELKHLLTEEEYEAAMSTVNDAFYTSPIVSQAIYEALENMGFKGGEVLEPSMGIGNFFGTMPEEMREKSNLTGVEIDDITGRIARQLYPEANIAINGFEKMKYQKGTFDLAVGNVPFGSQTINDKSKDYKGLLIHDYFFAKSLDSVRRGGIVAFVTSTGTLDKEDTKVRKMLAQKAEFLGAVRLPDNAFKGTSTATDIIFLKRRDEDLKLSEMQNDENCDWVYTKQNEDGFKVNSYFADNPEMVLGTLAKGNFDTVTCKAEKGSDLKERLHEAIQNIHGEYEPMPFQSELDEKAVSDYLPATPDVENLTYTVVNNKLYFRVDDNLIPLKESEQTGNIAERRKGMADLASTVRELLQAQVDNRPDSEIKKLQDEMTEKYDRFTKKFGQINPIEVPNSKNASGVSRKAANSNAFKNDVRLPLLQSLEKISDGQFVGKAEIFTERTIKPHRVVEHVDTAHEALILSISEKGKIDFEYMQNLTGIEKDKLIEDLKGDIYPVPELSEGNNIVYQTSDEYLSGNIYKKLEQAESAAIDNPVFADNIPALKEVIPEPLKATEIDMQLGMTWLKPELIEQFMYETFGTPEMYRNNPEKEKRENINAIAVEYSGSGKGAWHIQNKKFDMSVTSTRTFGTKDFNAYELLEMALNGKSPTVTKKVEDPKTGKEKTVVKENETRAAEDKLRAINEAFESWVFREPERRNELVAEYNKNFNCYRNREYDGSHLTFVGSNPEIQLKPHQKNAIAHALFGGNSLFAHEVGAGKTFEMIATAMEGKRLGLHNKSMFVVPNHLTEQIGADFMKLYPNANILIAKADDFSPQKRRQMCARIATGNFDAVIIGHSQLIKIPLSAEREQQFIKRQIQEITESLKEAKEIDGQSYSVKEMEKTKKSLQARLDSLVNSTAKDNAVTFEQLGIDKLFVDEAHEFKNLYIATKMENVSGLSTNDDIQKTQDLYMKCQYLDEITGNRGVTFSTGTPVTNALSEMFTTMKYLQSRLLKEAGLDSFDSWAGTFTKRSSEVEMLASGSWGLKTRLKFTNVPELVTMFKECADIKMADQLNLDVPECEKNTVVAQPTEWQKKIVETLGERAERIHKGGVSRSEDNMLVVTSDGRKLGLDQRLYDLKLPDEANTKINMCVDNVARIWSETAEQRSTQLIFCDLGVPQSKEDIKKNGIRLDVYKDLKEKLMEKGIPESEIAFIHEAKSEADKAKMFAKVRSGEIRILIGSTQKMGAGTNVQKRLIALHDLDCPWRPADLTQRLGRMVRQGNDNKKVYNYRYVTKGTFDSYLYQMVEKKQLAISQIFTSKKLSRRYDDIDESALDYRTIKIAAVGDDRIRRKMELTDEIDRLTRLENAHKETIYELQDNIRELPDKISKAEQLIANINSDIEAVKNYHAPTDKDGKEIFSIKIGNQTFYDRQEAGEALMKAVQTSLIGNPREAVDIAEYKGFKIAARYDSFNKQYIGTIKGKSSYSFEFGDSAIGNLTRIDNAIKNIPARLEDMKLHVARLEKQYTDSMTEVNKPFEHEQELADKKAELQQLENDINADLLELNKANQQPEEHSEPESVQPEQTTPEPEKSSADEKNVSEPPQKASAEKSESVSENTPTKETSPEKKEPLNDNVKWEKDDKKFELSFDRSSEAVKLFIDGELQAECSAKDIEIRMSKIDSKIVKTIPALKIGFEVSVADKIEKFVKKVKSDVSRERPLFSLESIMSDEFKPTSQKDNQKMQAQQHSK